jgi:pantoate--beta-alanine ligase
MFTTSDIAELRSAVREARHAGKRIGCVPTMGALHAGHMSLVEHCRRGSDFVVVTIFVNPTQFGAGEDFQKYPRPIDADLAMCEAGGVDAVYMPEVPSLYPAGYSTYVEVEGISSVLEGAIRPIHFRGVATIVTKLFHIVQPDVACFGAKDYQQQTLIRRMVRDLNLPVGIVVCPTVREADGLALSSRNVYLSPEERRQALSLWQSLQLAERLLNEGMHDIAAVESAMLAHLGSHTLVQGDYGVIVDPDSLERLTVPQPHMVALVAAKVGATRLIDNLTIELG